MSQRIILSLFLTCSANLLSKLSFLAVVDEYYHEVIHERIAILNALAAYYTTQAKISQKNEIRKDFYQRATELYNKATRINQSEVTTWIGKGELSLGEAVR